MLLPIRYRTGYKYILEESIFFTHPELPDINIEGPDGITIYDKVLAIKKGYPWDGPSGPTVDTKNFMPGSLVHDALYELMRCGALPLAYRKAADRILYAMNREHGMTWLRARGVYIALRLFGAKNASDVEKEIHPTVSAP